MNGVLNDVYDVLAKNEQNITQGQFVELLQDGTEIDNVTNTITLKMHGRTFVLSVQEVK